MKGKQYLALALVLGLTGCASQKEKETVKLAEPEYEVVAEEPQASTTQKVEQTAEEEEPQKELTRYDKAVSYLETTTSIKDDTSTVEKVVEMLFEKIREENRLDDYDLSDYLMSNTGIYDIKNDVVNLGYSIKSYSVVESNSDDVWQVLITVSNKEGKEGYYIAHYNTQLETLMFFYRDVEIDFDSMQKGE